MSSEEDARAGYEEAITHVAGSEAERLRAAANPYEFTPLPKQAAFMQSTADQIMLSGSFGAGKSKVGCEKGYMLNCRYPGNRGLVVRKTFSDVKASTVYQTLLDNVIPEEHIVKHNKSEHIIEHLTGTVDPNGDPVTSEIHYHGLDSGRSTGDDKLPRKVGSTSWGWIFFDEAVEGNRGEWAQLQGRLRYPGKFSGGRFYAVPFHQIFTATNPAGPDHWLYKIFYPPDPVGEVFEMSVADNPYNPPSLVRRLEQNLSGIYYERYVLGKWVGAEGMIYTGYDPTVHNVEASYLEERWGWKVTQEREWDNGELAVWAEPPEDWPLYAAVDFGYTNPFVFLLAAEGPDGQLVVFRELYMTELLVEDFAEEWYERLVPEGRTITATYADHDAEGRATLKRKGVSTSSAKKAVMDGIQSVSTRLKPQANGEPLLYFMEGMRLHEADSMLVLDEKPLKMLDEIQQYAWDEDKDGNPKEEPVKQNDHGMDGLRYLCYSRDGKSRFTPEEMAEMRDAFNTSSSSSSGYSRWM